MQEKARVVAIDGDIVSVVPLEIEACINCNNSECKKNGNVFRAVNRKGFSLEVGSRVRIAAPARNQLLQGVVSIGIPTLFAVVAYNALPSLIPSADEGLQAGAALAALAAGALATFSIAKPGKTGLPEVVEVFD